MKSLAFGALELKRSCKRKPNSKKLYNIGSPKSVTMLSVKNFET